MVKVIIPNWNGLDFIAECLDGLARQTVPHQVIVIDNGSTDGSMELVRDKYARVRLLSFADNAGFAGGVNRGLRVVLEDKSSQYAVLLNNDAVPAPDWLEHLVDAAEAIPRAGIITSKIKHYEDDRLDSTGDFYSIWGFPFPRGRDELDTGQYDSPDKREVFAGSGGASLYRVDMLRKIGLFDERFFAYFEDVDISFRAQLAGYDVRYEPTAVVQHHIGGTSSKMNPDGTTTSSETGIADHSPARPSSFARYHSIKNFWYVYIKNMPAPLFWKHLPKAVTSVVMMLISDVKRGQLGVNIKAHATMLANLPGILAERQKIQRARVRPIDEIDRLLYPQLPPLQLLRFRNLPRWLRPRGL